MTKTIIAVTACYMYFWCLNSSTYTIYNLRGYPLVLMMSVYIRSILYYIRPARERVCLLILVDGESKKFEFVLTGRLPMAVTLFCPEFTLLVF